MSTGTEQYTQEQWADMMQDWRSSGLSGAEWCRNHGVEPSLFYDRRKRLAKKGIIDYQIQHQMNPRKKDGRKAEETLPTVVQIDLAERRTGNGPEAMPLGRDLAESMRASQIVIEVPVSGCHIFVGAEFSQETLRRVMEVIR